MKHLPEYIFSHLAKEVATVEQKTGRKVLNLGPGSPDFPPSQIYLDKLTEYLHQPGSHLYPGYKAIPEFSAALVDWYKNRFRIELKTSQLLPLLGAKDAVSHLPLSLLEAGDEILVPDPGYPAYTVPAQLIGAVPVPYNPDLSDIPLSPKTKAIWANFPANPTGKVASLDQLKTLVDFCKKNKLWLLYDNAYSEITFDGYVAPSILQIPGAMDVAVEIGSFSKTFSFSGFRMGWIVGNPEVISAFTAVKSQFDSGLALPLQHLGAFALSNFNQDWYRQMLQNYASRRQLIATKLTKLDLQFDLPLGGLYLWAKIPEKCSSSLAFSQYLLSEKQVLVTPGSAFGQNGDRFVRVSICSNITHIDNYL